MIDARQWLMLIPILLILVSVSSGKSADGIARNPTKDRLDSLTLEQCLTLALDGNPDLKLAALGVQSAASQRREIAGQRLPAIGLVAGYSVYSENQRLVPAGVPNDPGAFGGTIFSGDVNLGMPLFTWGKITSEIGFASLQVKASEWRLERVRQEVIFQVSATFNEILAQARRVDAALIAKTSLKDHLKRVQELIQAGKAARVDLLKLQVRLAELEQRIIREDDALRRQKLLLANLMGLKVEPDSFAITGRLDTTVHTDEYYWNPDTAFYLRPDYQALQTLRDAQQRKLKSAQAVRLPGVSAYAAGGTRWMPEPDITQSGAEEQEWTAKGGIVLTMPLFQGGQVSARIQQQKIVLQEVEENLNKLRLQIRLEVESARINLNAAQARFAAGKAAVGQADETYRIEQEKYLLGKGTTADLLDAQAARLEAETNYYSALSDIKTASAGLRLALGVNQ